MRFWHRQSQPSDRQATVISRRATTDEAFDDLAKAAGRSTSRRGALKVLLLGVAGAAVGGGVGGGVLAASASGQRRATAAQTASLRACDAVIPTKCCTARQLKACEMSSTKAFARAAKKCARVCKNEQSAACRACAQAAANNTIASFRACVGQCGTVPTVGTDSSSGVASRVRTDALLVGASSVPLLAAAPITPDSFTVRAAASGSPCDAHMVNEKVAKADGAMGICLVGATYKCFGPPIACGIAAGSCFAKFAIDIAFADPCPFGTHCTPANVCCPGDKLGCPCTPGSSTGCCVDSSTDPNNCGMCTTSCTDCCFYVCCNAPMVCCKAAEGFLTCTDLQTDDYNCGRCGNKCSGKCCNGNCKDTDSDATNCGWCGHACGPSGDTCIGGTCYCGLGESCASGDTCCSGTCCSAAETCCSGTCCPAGVPCVGGVCSPPTIPPSP